MRTKPGFCLLIGEQRGRNTIDRFFSQSVHHAVERERSEAGSARVPADTLAVARPTQQTIKHTALLAQVAGAVEPGEAATQRVVVSHSLEQ